MEEDISDYPDKGMQTQMQLLVKIANPGSGAIAIHHVHCLPTIL